MVAAMVRPFCAGMRTRSSMSRGPYEWSSCACTAPAVRLAASAPISAIARMIPLPRIASPSLVELAIRTRQRHVEQALLLLDQRRAAGAELRWKAAIGHVQHVHRVPLLAFRRMHRREDQVVLVEMRIAREVARRCRRIERQLAQECFPASEVSRNAVQLREIRGAHLRLRVAFVIYPREMRLRPLLR